MDDAGVGAVHAAHLKRVGAEAVSAEDVPSHVRHQQRHWKAKHPIVQRMVVFNFEFNLIENTFYYVYPLPPDSRDDAVPGGGGGVGGRVVGRVRCDRVCGRAHLDAGGGRRRGTGGLAGERARGGGGVRVAVPVVPTVFT